jgi:uncharacterized protein
MKTDTVSRYPGTPVKRLSIYLTVLDQVHHRSTSIEILKLARKAKLAGATIFEGVEGYGFTGRIHRPHSLLRDAPLTVVIVDLPERVDAFLGQIADNVLRDVLFTVEELEVVTFPPARG